MPSQNKTPLYIFDVDGTICNIEHRLHFLEDKKDKDRWNKFYKACINDAPNEPVLRLLETLVASGKEIWFFSGRSEDVRLETEHWLHRHTSFRCWTLQEHPEILRMRPSGDYTEDHLLKQSWIGWMLKEDRDRLVCVFDDRTRVVNMWRANGIPCFQVAAGDF
jgi:hypothetical protein